MRKKLAGILVLAGTLLCTTCQNPVMEEVEGRLYYSVRVFPAPKNGTLRLSQYRSPGREYVTIFVNPDPGYQLKQNSIIAQPEISGGNPSQVSMRNGKPQVEITANMAVTAIFEPNTVPNTWTVSVDNAISNGFISAYPLTASTGSVIQFTLYPDPGYDLAPGTLTVNGTPVSETLPYTCVMGTENITVSARFEEKDYSGLKASAKKYLDAGNYDTAASFYEEAYKKNSGDPETILYTVFAKLGKLLLDNDVRSVLASMNMAAIPNTLDDWVCDSDWTGSSPWYQTWMGVSYDTAAANKNPPAYADVQFETEDAVLPQLNTRLSGFVGQFGDYPLAQGTNPDTRQKFNNLVFWILLSKNTDGFNGLLERINRYVFGEKFEAIAAIAESFPAGEKVLLNRRLKERFDLDEIYGPGDTFIGKEELDFIFANLRAIKAAAAYLSVYDWTINLRPWLTSLLEPDDGLDQILNKIFAQASANDVHKAYWADSPAVATILPFKNNFLNVRYSSYLNKSRRDLSRALAMAKSSMDYWLDPALSNFTPEARGKYQWAKDGISAAKAALDSNGVFYFPKKLPRPDSASVWPGEAAADYGINVAQFFTPGAFTLTNLFTTEWGGRVPSIFKIEWYEDGDAMFAPVFTGNYTLVTVPIPESDGDENVAGTGNSSPRGLYTFEVNTTYLKKLFPKGFSQFPDKALLSDVFPTIPLWPTRPTYFQGGRTSQAARNLYYYYHWR